VITKEKTDYIQTILDKYIDTLWVKKEH
jgi:hypothetical protein